MRSYFALMVVISAFLGQVLAKGPVIEEKDKIQLTKRGDFGLLFGGYSLCRFTQDNDKNPWQFIKVGRTNVSTLEKGGEASMSADYKFSSQSPYKSYYPDKEFPEYNHWSLHYYLKINETDPNAPGLKDCYVGHDIYQGGERIVKYRRNCGFITKGCNRYKGTGRFVMQGGGGYTGKDKDVFTIKLVAKTSGSQIYLKRVQVSSCASDISLCSNLKGSRYMIRFCKNMACRYRG